MTSNGSQQLQIEDPGASGQSMAPNIASSPATPPVTPQAVHITTSSTTTSTSDTLMFRLRAQVEFYFSQQNLSRDMYLRNLLSQYGGASVPLSVICSFPKVRDMCMSFNMLADPPLVMHALEGSIVAYVTPDALWISPMQPLPPIDANAKMRHMQPGFTVSRSNSISSMPEINGVTAIPNSPVKPVNVNGNANGNAHNKQGQGHTNGNQQQQQQQQQMMCRPTMSPRSMSLGTAQSVPIAYTLPQGMGMSVPAPGYVQYNYPYGNMPLPGKYPQPGYIYPPMQGHPPTPGPGGSQMQYPQMYPGYTYVRTTLAPGPHKYFPSGPPVLNRARSVGGPYDNTQRRNGPPAGMTRRLDGPKQIRKNKKKSGQNYDPGMQTNVGMTNGGSNGGRINANMPLNRSQNEVSDSSGQSKGKRRINKKNRDGNNDRLKDVSFDSNQFPALNPTKVKEALEKPPVAAISGYAAVLRAKNKGSPPKDWCDSGITNLTKNDFDADEADISKSTGEMNLSTEGSALTGTRTLLTEASSENPVNENHVSLKPVTVPVEAVKASEITAEIVEKFQSPTPKEAEDEGALESNSKPGSVEKVDPLLAKDFEASPSPPSAWGNKRSFIDAVRKQP